MGRNCLIIGPAGSGKLSLARALAATLQPRARQFLFDWEVELTVQEALFERLRTSGHTSWEGRHEAWILRRLDCFPTPRLGRLLALCSETHEARGHDCLVVYSTVHRAEDILSLPGSDSLFPWRINVAGLPQDPHAIEHIAAAILSELNRRYKKGITSIERGVIDLLSRRQWAAHYRELINVIERAYILESTGSVTVQSFQAAQGKDDPLRRELLPAATAAEMRTTVGRERASEIAASS